ncbi:YqaA family protein [Acetonema longum]|uniref:VTT domain-containing protein n=1 Tax=Acetonema longum DSM 6540 TaxID=1009370 RepID=F7NG66_9FIRM|nr:VTT domain-containing protein [Acetonema longum]EGO64984.1 hypothetical protein ALO_05263 [Acetonema longum DSM 6540]
MGLTVVTFTESFISPLMPDLILVPLCLADPANAIYYAALATTASVAGGFIGYGIGMWLGPGVLSRFPAARTAMEKVEAYSTREVAWVIFLAVMSPLPYKVISITAGALRVNFPMFILISFAGRAKRFMIEGVLIYYFGSAAIELIREYSLATTAVIVGISLIWSAVWWRRRVKKHELLATKQGLKP